MKRRQRARLEEFLHAYLEELRKIYRRRVRASETLPEPCADCAFRDPGGPWRGETRTAMHLLQVLESQPGGIFLCHHSLPFSDGDWQVPATDADRARARLCAGFVAVRGSDRARGATRAVLARLRSRGRGLGQ